MELDGINVTLNPVLSLPKHLKADVVANPAKQLKKSPTVASPEDMGTIESFDTEDEQDHEAQAQGESVP